jgi:signal transduction histidine kinase
MFWIGLGSGALAAALAAWFVIAVRTKSIRNPLQKQAQENAHLAKLGAMTAGLAHEIRNPLSTIGLNAQLLSEALDELALPEEKTSPLHKRINILRREVDRLGGILEDFLRYAGQLQLHPVETNIVSLLQELVDFFLPQTDRHSITLTLESPDAPLVASVDPSYLKQAILNLLLNATQAMDSHSRADSGNTLAISLHPLESNTALRIDIRDTGPGMSPEMLEQIFAPYFSTRPAGAGLGLPIAKRIIDAHQGTIDVASTPGKGTTFSITLPKNQPNSEPVADAPEQFIQ